MTTVPVHADKTHLPQLIALARHEHMALVSGEDAFDGDGVTRRW